MFVIVANGSHVFSGFGGASLTPRFKEMKNTFQTFLFKNKNDAELSIEDIRLGWPELKFNTLEAIHVKDIFEGCS